MNKLERYYEKFDEDKRLFRRHGKVEFFVTDFYIHKILKDFKNPKIIDIGAGTGAYAIPLSKEGYDVTAVEYVKSNLQKLRAKQSGVKTFLGDARDLNMFEQNTFDVTLLFGPMYHATNFDEKIKILNEAKRITKVGGFIMVAYCMNEYAVLVHGFRDGNILEAIGKGLIDKDFHTISKADDLYSFERLSDINRYKNVCGLKRIKIFSPDGASDYMRDVLNKMDQNTFEIFKKYQLLICEKREILGAGSHVVDVLKKIDSKISKW